jgi:hypothetical protein
LLILILMDKLLTLSKGHPSPPKISQTSLSGLTQFIPRYFGNFVGKLVQPVSEVLI